MKKILMIRVITGIILTTLFFGMMPVSTVMAAPKEENAESSSESEGENVPDVIDAEGEEDSETRDAAGNEPEQELTGNGAEAGMENGPEKIRPEYEETSYIKDIFLSQTTMQGIYSNCGVYFYVPEYWDLKYLYVELEYRVSQIISESGSTLTFYLNQSPVSSCEIAYEGGDSQIAYVRIPVELVQKGYNSFMIMAYSSPSGSCTDAFSSANWLSVLDTSHVRCGYEVDDQEKKIANYPYPFLSTINETGEGLIIAVSDSAENGEVAAAMNLMADLSSQTSGYNSIQVLLLSDVSQAEKSSTILVSRYENLPADLQKKVTDTNGIEDQGIVVLTEDADGAPLLIITSKDEECLMEAVYMLMDEDRVSQETGYMARVMAGSAQLAAGGNQNDQMGARNYTLEELNGGGLEFVGLFHQEQIIYLPFSEDYYLSEQGKISLQFRYSDNLDFNKSLVSVYLGDIPIGSKKLDRENAQQDELTVTIPVDLAGTSASSIKIAFDLELEDMACSFKQDQMPWAYVSEKSQFYLPVSSEFSLSFDAMPLPFRKDGKFNQVLLVISDKPTSRELNLYGQIVGMYGGGVEPYGTLYVKRASELSDSDGDFNIITAGTYENNTYLKAINDKLYFSYSNGGKGFESNEQLILSGNYSENIAIMQLLESPYASGRGILALTGVTQETLNCAEEILRDEKLRYSLSKDCVIIDKDLEVRSFRFLTDAQRGEAPTLAQALDQNKQSILFTIVATSVMLMLLIAVIIILLRIKMYHKKKDED